MVPWLVDLVVLNLRHWYLQTEGLLMRGDPCFWAGVPTHDSVIAGERLHSWPMRCRIALIGASCFLWCCFAVVKNIFRNGYNLEAPECIDTTLGYALILTLLDLYRTHTKYGRTPCQGLPSRPRSSLLYSRRKFLEELHLRLEDNKLYEWRANGMSRQRPHRGRNEDLAETWSLSNHSWVFWYEDLPI